MTNIPMVTVPRPPSDQANCDFCNLFAARWAYPAKDFEISLDMGAGRSLTVQSRGAWAACEECSTLTTILESRTIPGGLGPVQGPIGG